MSLTKKMLFPAAITGGICALVIATSKDAGAKAGYRDTIPNGKAYSCQACHASGSYKTENLNPFGKDYLNNGKIWDAALAKKDSDGDKHTNGMELGDEQGTWKTGDSDPNPGKPVYNPGDKDSHPCH